jgi:hypothetical protein
MLAPLTRVPGAVGLLAEHSDGTLAGGFFCFRYGSALYLWTAAIDQARKNDLHTHGWPMYESVRFAAATGASVLDTGRCNYRYKASLGMLPVTLTSAVYLTPPTPTSSAGSAPCTPASTSTCHAPGTRPDRPPNQPRTDRAGGAISARPRA